MEIEAERLFSLFAGIFVYNSIKQLTCVICCLQGGEYEDYNQQFIDDTNI